MIDEAIWTRENMTSLVCAWMNGEVEAVETF